MDINYENIINKISENDIKKFVLQKLYEDKNLQNEFRSHFAQHFEKMPKIVYEKRIEESIFYAIGKEGFIPYDETDRFSRPMYDYINEAKNLIRHNEYQIPFWIASIILEHLPDLPIDDSDGTTSDIEGMCIEVIEEILKNCKEKDIREEISKWITNSIENNTLEDYSTGIEKILKEGNI